MTDYPVATDMPYQAFEISLSRIRPGIGCRKSIANYVEDNASGVLGKNVSHPGWDYMGAAFGRPRTRLLPRKQARKGCMGG